MAEGFFSGWFDFWKSAKEKAISDQIEKNRLLSYWCALFDDFLCPPREFYDKVEEALAAREVPDLERDMIELREGSALSRKRLYLQMRRERLVFEICAAPFGTGYFVSSRLFDRRKQATWLDYGLLFIGLWGAVMFLGGETTPIVTIVILGFIITGFWSAMRLAAGETVKWLDERLYRMPIIGKVYESLFHPLTYFREDQNNMYREVVHDAVTDSIDALRAAQNLPPLSEPDKRPTVRDVFTAKQV